MKNTIRMWNGRVYGHEVSEYGRENNRLDYRTMAQIVGDMILANQLMEKTYEIGYWELENGAEYDEESGCYADVFQFYIVTDNGADWLKANTDELVYHNETLDLNLWGITHFGTGWDYVLSDVELVECETLDDLC